MPLEASAGEILHDGTAFEAVVEGGGDGRAEALAAVVVLVEEPQGEADGVSGLGEVEVLVAPWRRPLGERQAVLGDHAAGVEQTDVAAEEIDLQGALFEVLPHPGFGAQPGGYGQAQVGGAFVGVVGGGEPGIEAGVAVADGGGAGRGGWVAGGDAGGGGQADHLQQAAALHESRGPGGRSMYRECRRPRRRRSI